MAIEWYVKTNDKQLGPLSSAQLKELADRKRITTSTLVRRGDQTQWMQAGAIRDLFSPSPVPPAPMPAFTQPNPSVSTPASSKLKSPVVVKALVGAGVFGSLSLTVLCVLWLLSSGSAKSESVRKPAGAEASAAPANPPGDKPAAPGADRNQPPPAVIPPPEPPVAKPDPKLSAAYRKAVLLNQHGLDELAKAELIDIAMGKASPQEKAKALYLLGSIAFSEKRIGLALSTWRELVATYPEALEAVNVRDRIAQLAEMAGEGAKESANNAVAESYLRNASFWSDGRDRIFTIDSSWIPHVEAAIKWYDKVITEFPGTTASRMAHEDKLFTILGWKDRRYDAMRFGLQENFDKFMPMMQESLAAFEKEHPNASAIQAFRFQIAQAYWRKDDFDNARIWLEKIVAAAGNIDSFYGHLAKERLAHMR